MVRERHDQASGLWVGIDGIDATGKTTIVAALGRRVAGAKCLGEFSNSPVGSLIDQIIKSQRFFSLRPEGGTEMADLCLMFTDWVAKRDLGLRANSRVIFADRSYTSVVGYQLARLEGQLTQREASAVKAALLRFVKAVQGAQPIANREIVLTIRSEEMIARMRARGEHKPPKYRVKELLRAQEMMKELVPRTSCIDVSDLDVDTVVARVLALSFGNASRKS